MPVNEVFVGCLESDEYFNAAKLDELKKWEQFEVYDEVKDVVQKYLTGGDGFALRKFLMREEYQKQDL